MSSVYPSGGALATIATAICPLAPGRFSTTTCCPRVSLSVAAAMRAIVSVPPCGAEETIRRSAFVGYDCAPAGFDSEARTMTAAHARRGAGFRYGIWTPWVKIGFVPSAHASIRRGFQLRDDAGGSLRILLRNATDSFGALPLSECAARRSATDSIFGRIARVPGRAERRERV